MPASSVIPEILEAERLVTRPLRAPRGWVVRERVAGKWVDHPQVRWPDALAAVRKLRAETAVYDSRSRRASWRTSRTPFSGPARRPRSGEPPGRKLHGK